MPALRKYIKIFKFGILHIIPLLVGNNAVMCSTEISTGWGSRDERTVKFFSPSPILIGKNGIRSSPEPPNFWKSFTRSSPDLPRGNHEFYFASWGKI